jgi:hypothetical protein
MVGFSAYSEQPEVSYICVGGKSPMTQAMIYDCYNILRTGKTWTFVMLSVTQ